MKSIRMAYNKGTKIVDEAEEDLKSLFSMDGQLFKNDEYVELYNKVSYYNFYFKVPRKIQKHFK